MRASTLLLLRLWSAPVEDEASDEPDSAEAPEAPGGTLFFGTIVGGGMGPTTRAFGHFGLVAGSFGRRIGGHLDVALLARRPIEVGMHEVGMLGFLVGASVCHVPRSRGGRLLLPICGGFEGGLLSANIGPADTDGSEAVYEGILWGAGRLSVGAMLDLDGLVLGTTWTLSVPTYRGTFPSVVPSLESITPLGFRVSFVFAFGGRT